MTEKQTLGKQTEENKTAFAELVFISMACFKIYFPIHRNEANNSRMLFITLLGRLYSNLQENALNLT